jgi:iron complex transport system substrate-binding protein
VSARLAMMALALATSLPAAAEPARSIVSLNLCTDQLALDLAPSGSIKGLSPYSQDKTRSPLATEAAAIPILSGTAEEAMVIRPDLVVVGLHDRQATQLMLRRQGLRLEAFDIVRGVDEAKEQIARMGRLVGGEAKAAARVADIDAAVARLKAAAAGRRLRVLPYARRGWVEGGGTLLSALLDAAGLANVAGEAGLTAGGFLGLEAIVRLRPDALVIGAERGEAEDQGSALLLHPAVQALFPPERRIVLSDALFICGGPTLATAIDRLAGQIAGLTPRER